MSNPTTPFSWQMPTATDLVTDLPADFEVFGQAVATSMADLLGGASGYILSKASATDMDFAWIANDQGDITGITATTPLTGGGSSGAITVGIQDALTTQKGAVQLSDSTSTTSSILAATPTAVKSAYDLAAAAIPKSTVTTNGDVIYATGSSAVTRLGIGSAGQVLTVAAGVPSWATAASGGGLTLLSTTALTGASTTVSSISGSYKALKILVTGATNNTADGKFSIKFNALTADAYLSVGEAGVFTNQQNTTFQTVSNVDRTNAVFSFNMDVFNYANTTYPTKPIFASTEYFATGAVMKCGIITGVQYLAGTAISSVTVANAGGTFSAGTILIYGVS